MGASSRMRFYQYLPDLQSQGIEIEVSPLLSDGYLKRLYAKQATNWRGVINDYLKQMVRLLTVRDYDLLWIEKELFPNLPPWFEQVLARRGVRYVADYDDAVFHNYDQSLNPLKRLVRNKIDSVMQHAALVVCGNSYLAERACCAGARRVEVIPTVVDLNRYAVVKPREHGKLVIGWIGSPSTVKYLDLVAEPLKELARELPVQLRVVGASCAVPGLDVVCRTWTEAGEAEEIQQFDLGIMPLADSPWERGKCGYKLIQYMACGLPVVASPVGVNTEIVAHGVNGFLAQSQDEWLTAIRALSTDAASRRDIGARGRRSVEQNYCLQVTAPRLARLFHEILAGRMPE